VADLGRCGSSGEASGEGDAHVRKRKKQRKKGRTRRVVVVKRDIIVPPRVRPAVAAKMFGVSVRTLWRMEEAGKLGTVERTQSGARRYSPENVARIAAYCPKARETLGEGAVRVEWAEKRPGLTVGQAALVFGVHVRTLQRWEKEGKYGPLPRDHRGVRRFTVEDLAAVEKLVYGGVGRKPPWLAQSAG